MPLYLMQPRKKPNYTADSIDQQLQQIHLLDPSSSSENLEQLGPIIRNILTARHQDVYLRTLKSLIHSKEQEIEHICGDNYQDFVGSTETLLTVRQYTHNLQDKINTLDGSVALVGQGLLSKKQELLKLKATSANLDDCIDSLQSCLRVLDVINRAGDMIREGKYWSALRSLEDIQNLPPSSLSQTPLFTHLLSSVPSLRTQIKDAVTEETKSWLSYIRHDVTEVVGKLALDAMESRTKRWRVRQERDPGLRHCRVGSAVELASNEGKEVDVLDNEKLRVDFKPLYQCIHIHSALGSLDKLQRSYHADRKEQATLILPHPMTLPKVLEVAYQISGFFIIESNVLRTTRNFRSEREIEELWEEAVRRLGEGVQEALRGEEDPELYVAVKECLVRLSMTMEGYGYSITSLHAAALQLLEKDNYLALLETQCGKALDEIVTQDELIPMRYTSAEHKEAVLQSVWLTVQERGDVMRQPIGIPADWSDLFYSCCKQIRMFATAFDKFIDGVGRHHHHRDVDSLLGKALDNTLAHHISDTLSQRVTNTSVLSQLAQVVTNLEYFEAAVPEIETSLPAMRRNKGDAISLPLFSTSLSKSISTTMTRINTTIRSKLNDVFELSEYDWTPTSREKDPSTYLYELVNWLTTVVDSLTLRPAAEENVYRVAIIYVAECMMDFIVDPALSMINENGLANLLVDVEFLESQLRDTGREHLISAFEELRNTIVLPLDNKIDDYLNPATRHSTYASVKPKRLSSVLEKLAKYSLDRSRRSNQMEREKGERRKREAETVGRIYPGEGRSNG